MELHVGQLDVARRSQTVQIANVGIYIIEELLGCLVKLLFTATAEEQAEGLLSR